MLTSCKERNGALGTITFNVKLYEAYDNKTLFPILSKINEELKSELIATTDKKVTGVDLLDQMIEDGKAHRSIEVEFPLWSILYPSVDQSDSFANPYSGPVLGIANHNDTTLIRSYLSSKNYKRLLPDDIKLVFNPIHDVKSEYLQLIGLVGESMPIDLTKDSSFEFKIEDGVIDAFFSGIQREIVKRIEGETFAVMIQKTNDTENILEDKVYVLSSKINWIEKFEPISLNDLKEPYPICIITEEEKNNLLEMYSELFTH